MGPGSPKESDMGLATPKDVGPCTEDCPGWEGTVGEICPLHYPDGACEVDLTVPAVKWRGKWYAVDDGTAHRIERGIRGHGK